MKKYTICMKKNRHQNMHLKKSYKKCFRCIKNVYGAWKKDIEACIWEKNVKHVFEKYCKCIKINFQSFICVKKLDFKASIWKNLWIMYLKIDKHV